MSKIEQRLNELGVTLPPVVPPVAAYTPALRDGDLVYTSGQLPMIKGELTATGKVGGAISAEQANELAKVCAINGLAAIKEVIGDLDKIVQIVKIVGFVSSEPDFTGQPGVVNGASEFLGDVFGEQGVHARSAVGVAVLPLDAPVEIEFTVRVAD